MIPPEQNAGFVANMEDILELYRQPFNPSVPVICMDEQPVQLIEETRNPIQTAPYQPQRYDYEYKRNGTAKFLCLPNLWQDSGVWMFVKIKQELTGHQVKEIIEKHYQDASKIILVCDNYSTIKYHLFMKHSGRRCQKYSKKIRDSLYSKTRKLA